MNNLDLKILGSSSHGNCYLLGTSEETLIIECGLNIKTIQTALEFDLSKVAGCLVSHEHQDHSKSIKELTKRSINVYSSADTFIALGIKSHRAIHIKKLVPIKIGGFTVLPFHVEHDAVDPLGFLIQHEEIGKLLFVTDTYFVKYKFKDLDYLMIECNYSAELVKKRAERGQLNDAVVKRLFTSHFSLENVKKFIRANRSDYKGIYLMHLSDGNSDAKLFKKEIEKLTGTETIIC